jgi:hypothetical protein
VGSASNPLEYILANPALFDIRLVCKITDVDEHIDSCVVRGDHQQVAYINTELDFCVYLEGIAFNDFDDFRINVRCSFGDDREAHKQYLAFSRELLDTSEAVLLSSSAFTLVENELAFYDPRIERLGFSYDEIK